MRPAVHEVLRPRVHDEARLHTNNVDYRYQLKLSATCPLLGSDCVED